MANRHCLIAITSWYIEYVYYNYLSPVCKVITFEINHSSIIRKSGQKWKYLKNE